MAKLATLTDDFSGSGFDPSKWYPPHPDPTIAIVNGRVELQNSVDGGGRNVSSATLYDWTNSYAFVQCGGDLAANPRLELILSVTRGGGGGEHFVLTGTDLSGNDLGGTHIQCWWSGYIDGGGATLGYTAPYDPVRMSWLRLRADTTTIYWDVSPNGQNWVNLFSTVDPYLDLTQVMLVMEASSTDGNPVPGVVWFDNVNTTAPTPMPSLAEQIDAIAGQDPIFMGGTAYADTVFTSRLMGDTE